MARMVGRRGLVVVAVCVVVATSAGLAYATGVIPLAGTGAALVGCVQKENGAVRIVSSRVQCRPVETAVLFATPPHPTVETVNCGSGQSLQQAVNAADRTQPLTITVVGTCAESVFVTRDQVTLLSGSPGSGIDGGLTFAGQQETVQGLTLTGGDGGSLLAAGGAVVSTSDLHVKGSVNAGNNAVLGLSNVTIDHCSGGVNASFGANVTVDAGSITGCSNGVTASSGATVWLTDGVTVTNATRSGAVADNGGVLVITSAVISNDGNAGVTTDGGSVTINDTPVTGNGHGVDVHDGGYVDVIDGSVISGNDVGIVADTGSHVVVGSDNSDAGGGIVKNNAGIGIEVVEASTLQIGDPASVTGNGGDGISLSDTSVGTFNDPTVAGNGGWGVHCDTAPSVAVIRGPTDHVTGNTAGQVDCANAGQPD